MPLISVGRDGTGHISGTAVMIRQYMGLTAVHVVEDHWKKHEYRYFPKSDTDPGEASGTHAIWAIQRIGFEIAIWAITKIWAAGHSDIAVVHLTPFSDHAVEYATTATAIACDVFPPSVGERVSCCGYPEVKVTVDPDPDAQDLTNIAFSAPPITTVGAVTAVYEKVGRGLCKWPSFEVNARFAPGMSGGPVFNDQGRLCGIVCASWDFAEGHAGSVSSLWPIMATPVDIDRTGHPPGAKYPLLELAQEGFVTMLNHDRVFLVEDQPGQYRPGFITT